MALGASERLAFILSLDANSAIREFRRVGDTADRELGRADNRLDRLGSRMQSTGAGMVAAAGVAGAALFSLGQDAAELEQSVGGTEAVFGDAADVIERFAESAAQSAGLSERSFREATTGIGGNLKRMGFEVDAAAARSVELTQVAADLAATYGGTTAEAVNALGAAFRGEADPAERFNLNLRASAVAARAVEMGLAESTGQVSENARAQAILALVTEQSADAQGQFAREADTASGAMAIAAAEGENMRASLGEAVAPILADVSERLADAAGWVVELNERTDGGVGKFAAYATAGVGLVGAISLVSGTVIKARDGITSLATSLNVGERGLGRMATAGKGLAAAGIAFTIAEIADAATGAGDSISDAADEFSRLSDAELLSQYEAFFDDGAILRGVTRVNELFRELAETNHGTAQRLRETAEAAGYSADVLAAMDVVLEETAAGSRQAAVDQSATALATDEVTEALGEETEALMSVAEQLDVNRQRNEEALAAQQARVDGVLGAIDAERALEDALIGTNTAITTYNTVSAESGAASAEASAALRDADDAARGLAEAADSAARAEAELNGEQYTAEDSARVQRDALQSVADSLAPGSPLRIRLEEYIARLNAIPSNLRTTHTIETVHRGNPGSGPGITDFSYRAAGGPYDKGKAYVVGEQGPEWLIPDHSGVVVPGANPHAVPMRSLGGGADMAETNSLLRGILSVLKPSTNQPARPIALDGMAERDAIAQQRAVA